MGLVFSKEAGYIKKTAPKRNFKRNTSNAFSSSIPCEHFIFSCSLPVTVDDHKVVLGNFNARHFFLLYRIKACIDILCGNGRVSKFFSYFISYYVECERVSQYTWDAA